MCIEYDLNGKKIDYLPAAVEDQLKIKPIYKIFDGWKTSTKGIKNILKYTWVYDIWTCPYPSRDTPISLGWGGLVDTVASEYQETRRSSMD